MKYTTSILRRFFAIVIGGAIAALAPTIHAAPSGWFIEGLGGATSVYTKSEFNLGFTDRVSDYSPSFAIRGGYDLNRWIGFEAMLIDFGQVKYKSVDEFNDTLTGSIENRAFTIGAKPTFPLHETVQLDLRGGFIALSHQQRQTDSASPDNKLSEKKTRITIYAGAGLHYFLNDSYRFSLEYLITRADVEYEHDETYTILRSTLFGFGYTF